MKLTNLNLREMPYDGVVGPAKAEAARRGLTIREWMIETIKFRLDLLDRPRKKAVKP